MVEQDGTPVVTGTDQGVVPMTGMGGGGPVGTEGGTEHPQVIHATSDEGVNADKPTSPPQNPNHPEERYEEGYVQEK